MNKIQIGNAVIKVLREQGIYIGRDCQNEIVDNILAQLQPPPEEKPEVGDRVEILELGTHACNDNDFLHKVGVIADWNNRGQLLSKRGEYRIEINDNYIAYATKVRLISKAPPASPPKTLREILRDWFGATVNAHGAGIDLRLRDNHVNSALQDIDRWLEGLKGKLEVSGQGMTPAEYKLAVIFALQQKIREER